MGNFQKNPKKILLWSTQHSSTLFKPSHWLSRERREHKIFEHMLTSIPGLQERLMENSPEETRLISDLVRSSTLESGR